MSYRNLICSVSVGAMLPFVAATSVEAGGPRFLSDVVVDGSLCVGIDCPATPSFGFDTQRFQENNLRVHFQDTSASASFPTNDWRITINDSSNGGASYFAIEDATAGRIPFRVEAGARANALYVEGDGDVGIGNANPVVNLHITEGNTPTLRLEQDGSSGFTPQTYDVAANEANFFIRDVTNSSRLFFRSKPGAPEDSIYIAANGDIGLGTDSPDGPLHLRGNSTYITLDDADSNDKWFFTHQDANDGNFEITNELNGSGTFTLALVLQPDGDMTIDGTLTQNSDKNAKMAIEPVDATEVLNKLTTLEVSQWTYIDDTSGARHMGPMAQDFHALFGLGETETGISTLDTSGVALAAIQALHQQNEELRARLELLEQSMN